jgi:GNAT superfamily N-acetyltransferase
LSAPNLTIQKLRADHALNEFDCGKEDLNRFIKHHALVNQQAGGAQTYIGCQGDQIVGFYSLAVGSVAHSDAPARVTKGLAKHPVPVMLLARLAVDRSVQGKGVGRGLLKDALYRTVQAADIAGIRALLVHAKDEDARQFYTHFNFDASPSDPYHLFLLVKDIRRIIGN